MDYENNVTNILENNPVEDTSMENPSQSRDNAVNVIASKYRSLADKVERDWQASGNPGTLPRLYFDAEDGSKIEKIRGFDLCLVHLTSDIYVGCEEKVQRRGLCSSHHTSIAYRVKVKELTSWEKLEAAHKVLPAKPKTLARSAVSADDYILEI